MMSVTWNNMLHDSQDLLTKNNRTFWKLILLDKLSNVYKVLKS